jgi:GntR family transcriptional regulator/MocR family aminotransferase
MFLKLTRSGLLHLQIYQALRAAILSGKLPAGARLPSSRALATEVGVSRNTVLLAYDQLLGEGYAVSRHGSGTYVPDALPTAAAALAASPVRAPESARPGRRRASPAPPTPPSLSRLGRVLDGWSPVPTWAPRSTRLPYDFRYGRPAPADFPGAIWRRLLARRLRAASVRDIDYGSPGGAPALREAVAEYLQRDRAVACTAEQVVIVYGSQQALDLTARVLLDPGDAAVLEEPHYPGARGVLAAAGAQLCTAPVDAEGVDIAALVEPPPSRPARLVYVTPSHQFPTGAVMSLTRRLALLAWAAQTGAYVLEDDYDSEYRYGGRPVEALQGLDQAGRVVYMGTFSKVMFPALRLGYVVPPEPLVKPFLIAKAIADTGCGTIEQLALADFIRGGHFGRHVRRTRARNAARRAALLGALAEHLGNAASVAGANAGLHVLVRLDGVRPRQTKALIQRAAERGVGVYSAAGCYLHPPARAELLLGYNALTESQIREGIRRLARVLRAR